MSYCDNVIDYILSQPCWEERQMKSSEMKVTLNYEFAEALTKALNKTRDQGELLTVAEVLDALEDAAAS